MNDDDLFAEAMRKLDVNPQAAPRPKRKAGGRMDADSVRRAALGLDQPSASDDVPADGDGSAYENLHAMPEPARYAAAAEEAEFAAAMLAMDRPGGASVDAEDGPPPEPLIDGKRELARVHVGTPKTLRRRIKQGLVPHQAELDLHGLNREQARQSLERFIRASVGAGHGVVRVITGRGLHSDSAILMNAVAEWAHGPLAKFAYTCLTAPQAYGGEGVSYFFLRRFAAS